MQKLDSYILFASLIHVLSFYQSEILLEQKQQVIHELARLLIALRLWNKIKFPANLDNTTVPDGKEIHLPCSTLIYAFPLGTSVTSIST